MNNGGKERKRHDRASEDMMDVMIIIVITVMVSWRMDMSKSIKIVYFTYVQYILCQ